MPRTALIIGGGVAGPATALLLNRLGWQVGIFEAGAEPDEYTGSFLNVATNGLSVLHTVGVRDRLLTDAHRCPHMVMWSGRGKRLGEVPNGPAGDPLRGSVVVRRGWLHRVLREAAGDAGLSTTFGARLTGIADQGRGVVATFADGRTAAADILIGCDGINSVTRRYIDRDAPEPTYTGLIGVGGFARHPHIAPTPDRQHFVFGRRSFFGYLVRADGEIYWFANVTRPEPAPGQMRATTTQAWLAELSDLHRDDPDPVPQILAANTGEVRGYPVHDLHHVARWARGRVVAVGDAVHATSPSAGQGAALALEDSVVLAQCLRDLPEPDDAFAAYQRLRQPRVEQVVRYAQEITRRKTISRNPLSMLARDALLPLFLRRAATDTTTRWLYDIEIPWERPVHAAAGPAAGRAAG
jgi:2-polyprenyl-6-methoxyphenol hydroxylase-like FAD-dependent oxidoreductase